MRSIAITQSLFAPVHLKAAISKLGFVQADPIRAPARAQDLILRHRVKGYRAGDLERRYADLDIEEDLLYAYGFLPRSNWQLLHPRQAKDLSKDEKTVLKVAKQHGELHPRDLESHLGKERMVNAWGGYSKVSTRILENLHYRGLLRIVGRQDGIKIYEIAPTSEQHLTPEDRANKLVMLIARILSPIPESSLRSTIRHLKYSAPTASHGVSNITRLLASGELESAEYNGVKYIFPAGTDKEVETPHVVRFLAPFDPVVWDRRRFEHLWGWAYRFEAYTPPPKRKMGYYALPLLWGDRIIGWANVSVVDGRLKAEAGYVDSRPPRDAAFRAALRDETERMADFLGVK